jgi:membrane-associated phospholipid phosphatase
MTDVFRETLEDPAFGACYSVSGQLVPGRMSGAHTGLLLLVLTLAVGLLYWLAIAVLSGSSAAIDSTVLLHVQRYEYLKLTRFATLVCMLVTCGSVLVLVYLCCRRRWQSALFWLGSTAGAAILAGIAKKAVQRHRPELWALASRHASFSFPSGHATQSMAFVIALLLLAPPEKRKTILALGLAWVCLVGISRLYLGLHYPTDILAGWALALAWCCLLGLLLRLPRKTSH